MVTKRNLNHYQTRFFFPSFQKVVYLWKTCLKKENYRHKSSNKLNYSKPENKKQNNYQTRPE